jgi:hypothetical protein
MNSRFASSSYTSQIKQAISVSVERTERHLISAVSPDGRAVWQILEFKSINSSGSLQPRCHDYVPGTPIVSNSKFANKAMVFSSF